MTKSRDLFTTDRPYVTLYDAIYKRVVLNYETKSKHNERKKRNETKYYETQRNVLKGETKRNATKRNLL
jgi:hypothetical protein